MRQKIGYADALKILGAADSRALATIDRLLGGAITGTAIVTGHLELLALLDARDELIKQSSKFLLRFGQRVRGASGSSRTDLLIAAHAVVAINAYFEALHNPDLLIGLKRLNLTGTDQLALAGSSELMSSHKLAEALIHTQVPLPTPHRPYEQSIFDIKIWYERMSDRLLHFVKGLAVWDEINETQRSQLNDQLLQGVPIRAVERYEEGFRRLADDCAEFRMWMYITDSAAIRAAIAKLGTDLGTGLTGLQLLLESLGADRRPREWPGRLAAAYQAQLHKPIAEASPGEALAGLIIPLLGEGYVNPRLRVASQIDGARSTEESWWQDVALCNDVQWLLAGHLTSPAAFEVPLVILGQPGSGKSVLTKVLAARLPPAEYLPIRVELRHVAADARPQDQIEAALRETTGERMEWPQLVSEAGDTLPVVILDGFDELLQSTGVSRSDYLEQIRDFQRRELDQGRRVAVIVTCRIAVADRVRFPEGTVVAKLEQFDDDQISRWLTIWNDINSSYLQAAGLSPLSVETVLAHYDLAALPLLLLMLAFYDADGNALQQRSGKLAKAELYERLLTKFVDREIDKHHRGLDDRARAELTATELQRLSVVAFAMFNRGRKSVTEDDLDTDLVALLPQDKGELAIAGPLSRRLTPAQLMVGRFFFIHKSQALVDTIRLNVYEFLHATFGEYLVARLVFNTLTRIIRLKAADDIDLALSSSSQLADDDLWKLLSFTPLTDGSQAIRFLSELIEQLDNHQRTTLRGILAVLFRSSMRPREMGYRGYEPRHVGVAARHAAYSANLLILNVLAAPGPLKATDLFGSHDRTVMEWRSFVLLWCSQLDVAGWDGLDSWLNIVAPSQSRAPQFSLSDDRGLMIGMSLSRDRIDAVLTSLQTTRTIALRTLPLLDTSPQSVVRTAVNLARELRDEAGEGQEILGLGVALAGRVDGAGTVYFAPDLQTLEHRWDGVPLEADLEEATRPLVLGRNGHRVVVENDANALAVYEHLMQRTDDSVAAVLVSGSGEGIGCGLVIDGTLVHGAEGVSGEIGHIALDPNGKFCRCGARGCLETMASPSAIMNQINLRSTSSISTLEDASALVERGDPAAAETFVGAGEALGRALSMITAIVGPPRLVVYGPGKLTDAFHEASAHAFLQGLRNAPDNVILGVRSDMFSKVLAHATLPTAAAATAVHYFLSRPRQWMPTIASLGDASNQQGAHKGIQVSIGTSDEHEMPQQ